MKQLATLSLTLALVVGVQMPSEPEAGAAMTLYGCTLRAWEPSGSVLRLNGFGTTYCDATSAAIAGSKTCLRLKQRWSFDWQGACRGYTMPAGVYTSNGSSYVSATGSWNYRTRHYARVQLVSCACPPVLWYDESNWRQF